MPKTCSVVMTISGGLLAICSLAASAQTFPVKPIRFMASSPGSGIDIIARLIAQGLAANLNRQVIVENRGGSVIARSQMVLNAPPDGYALLVTGASHWLLPLMQANMPFDPIKDFTPVVSAAIQPNALVVHPSLPVKSVGDLIKLAKANPGALNCATGAPGALTYLSAELFKNMAGVDILGVPYKGSGPALAGVFSGEAQLMFPVMLQAVPHLKYGKIRVLAVTSAKPISALPGLPTVAAALPGYESGAKYAFFAPGKTPAAIVNQLNQEIVRVLESADTKEKLVKVGAESVGGSPEDLVSTMRRDLEIWGKVIKSTDIRIE